MRVCSSQYGTIRDMTIEHSLTTTLIREYGLVVGADKAAHLLGFRTAAALAKARQRGQLSVPMFQLPHRRGWFTETRAIAEWLSIAIRQSANPAAEASSTSPGYNANVNGGAS